MNNKEYKLENNCGLYTINTYEDNRINSTMEDSSIASCSAHYGVSDWVNYYLNINTDKNWLINKLNNRYCNKDGVNSCGKLLANILEKDKHL